MINLTDKCYGKTVKGWTYGYCRYAAKYPAHLVYSTETLVSQLNEDLKLILLLGGGIFGITTAYLLKQAGVSVAVLDADRILKNLPPTPPLNSLLSMLSSMPKLKTDGWGWPVCMLKPISMPSIWLRSMQKSIQCDFVRLPAYTYPSLINMLGKSKRNDTTQFRYWASFQGTSPALPG